MGNYRARRSGFLKAWKIQCAHWMFEGRTDKEIVYLLEGARLDQEQDPEKKKKLYVSVRDRLYRLRKDPKFREYYQSLITEWRVHSYGPALKVLGEQLKSDEPWLANKAANDVLNRIGTDPFTTGEDAASVTIKFEGMPELGAPSTPSTEEADG